MDSLNYEAQLRQFREMRLHPWIVEHRLFIIGELAKLETLEPLDYARFKDAYDKKMTAYVAEHPDDFPKVEPVKASEPSVLDAEVPVTVKKKKTKKSSPQ